MLIEHDGARPRIHPSAYVAPNAVLCGDVEVGPDCRILFGAVLTAEDGPVRLGERCIVMENAVLRGRSGHPARLGAGAEIRINGVLHVNSSLPDGAELPIGWIAVGDPAQMFPPKAHDEIWAIQRTLDFAGTVAGVDTSALAGGSAMSQLTATYATLYGRHRDDEVIAG